MRKTPTKTSYAGLLIVCALGGACIAAFVWSVVQMFETLKQFL
jgi:hypothetical protein